MLQNTRAITFIVSELLKENQQGRGWGGIRPSHPDYEGGEL